MERHAVPQNIMEVEFKLFGALTVRQFAYLAGGLLGGLMIYFLPFPGLLRFALIIISVILGFFLSLVKINGQYSSVWLANFVVAMFTSQERVWKKTGIQPDVFHEEVKKEKEATLEKVKKEGRIKASIAPLSKFEVNTQPTEADRSEELRLKQIEEQMFGMTTPTNNVATSTNMDVASETSIVTIKGYVFDKDTKPVSGALVSVNTEAGDFVKEVVTDDKGYFDLGMGLEPAVYFANVASKGLDFDYYKIRIKPDQQILYKFKAK
jgi:hypothetical protein